MHHWDDSAEEPSSSESSSGEWVGVAMRWIDSEVPALPRLAEDPGTVLAVGQELVAILEKTASLASAKGSKADDPSDSCERRRRRWSLLSNLYAAAFHRLGLESEQGSEEETIEAMTEVAFPLYGELRRLEILEGQGLLLQAMSWPRRSDVLQRLIRTLVDSPPGDWSVAALALSPLMRNTDWDAADVFPELLQGMHHPALVAPVLDLANFVTREGMLENHPAADAEDSLIQMLGGVVAQLGMLEEDPGRFGDEVKSIHRILNDAVALCVALCDTLALMDCQPAIGKLHQALSLRHRRVQTEAAYALARLDQEIGRQTLIGLAAEPVARLRVVRYAEELGLLDAIDESYLRPSALAESELALWLAQPQQLSVPPAAIELVDQRTLFWPGYHEPQDCFLFRFRYSMPQGEWSNVGIAGPLVHSFAADLADLPIFDIYSVFAGWHVQHEEIFEVPVERWTAANKRQAEPLQRALDDQGFHSSRPLWLGHFLGEVCLVAEVSRDNTLGVAVTDGLETISYYRRGRSRPIGPVEAYSIYKGRKMLRSFNPDNTFELADDSDLDS